MTLPILAIRRSTTRLPAPTFTAPPHLSSIENHPRALFRLCRRASLSTAFTFLPELHRCHQASPPRLTAMDGLALRQLSWSVVAIAMPLTQHRIRDGRARRANPLFQDTQTARARQVSRLQQRTSAAFSNCQIRICLRQKTSDVGTPR